MPGKVAKIGTFSDWVGLFDDWRKEIGVNHDGLPASSSIRFSARSRPRKSSLGPTRAAASGKTCARYRRSRCGTRSST